jgi:hypothetical protein
MKNITKELAIKQACDREGPVEAHGYVDGSLAAYWELAEAITSGRLPDLAGWAAFAEWADHLPPEDVRRIAARHWPASREATKKYHDGFTTGFRAIVRHFAESAMPSSPSAQAVAHLQCFAENIVAFRLDAKEGWPRGYAETAERVADRALSAMLKSGMDGGISHGG